jgi:4-hydroxybenzoate polyprenyltransferase
MTRARLLAFAQLLRIPNVFTAFADIALCGCVAAAVLPSAEVEFWFAYALIGLASGCLYLAGMVWNDVFDLDEDKKARAFRPLPSGRVAKGTAVALGLGLFALGIGLAAAAGWPGRAEWNHEPAAFALGIVAAVLVYDGGAKRTPAGPVAMGACRFLNVLFGLSLVPDAAFDLEFRIHLAAVVGLYIVGVTWFARTEESKSRKRDLGLAAGVMALALVLALWPDQAPRGAGHGGVPVPARRVRVPHRPAGRPGDRRAGPAPGPGRGQAVRPRPGGFRRGPRDDVRRPAGTPDPFVVAPGPAARKMGLLHITQSHVIKS